MIFGRIKIYLAAVGAFAVALFMAYARGKTDKSKAIESKRLQDYAETRKRMDEASAKVDPDASRSWLQWRSEQ